MQSWHKGRRGYVVKAIDNANVELSVVLGKAVMPIHQLLKMGRGTVIELDATVHDPMPTTA